MASIFISYSHKDEALRNQLEIHLAMLKREGLIDVWHDRRIPPGDDIDDAIDDALERSQVVLLMCSPDFLHSRYCYEREVERAMELHKAGKARVLPVILRTCEWNRAPFGKLRATPTDGKPVVKWPDADDALHCVVQDIRTAIATAPGAPPAPAALSVPASGPSPTASPKTHRPRSGNLRVRQEFTDADKDKFLDEAFDYVANYFEASLEEMAKRNHDIKTTFKRIDARKFTAVIYRAGQAQARCRIGLDGGWGSHDTIVYSNSDSAGDNSFNESMSVEEGEQILFLRPMGMASWSRSSPDKLKLTHEGAAEYFWGMLIEPLQR